MAEEAKTTADNEDTSKRKVAKIKVKVTGKGGIYAPHSDDDRRKRGKGEKIPTGEVIFLPKNKKTNQWLHEGRVELALEEDKED